MLDQSAEFPLRPNMLRLCVKPRTKKSAVKHNENQAKLAYGKMICQFAPVQT